MLHKTLKSETPCTPGHLDLYFNPRFFKNRSPRWAYWFRGEEYLEAGFGPFELDYSKGS
jgi:hypothetical protein